MKYVKKPIIVEAFQMSEARMKDCSSWPDWLLKKWGKLAEGLSSGKYSELLIPSINGDLVPLAIGDWLVRDSTGKIYPCKPDVFEAMYDEAETYRQPNDRFIQGYACAVATLIRLAVATLIRLNEGATTDVKELFRGGLNMDTLGAHGVDEDDINIFRKYEN